MAVKRIVDTQFWEDAYIMDHYTVEDKYFMLYLMTNPRTTQIGIYALPKKIMSFETGYSLDDVSLLLERLSHTHGKIAYCEATQELSLLDSLTYSIVKGGKPVSDLLEKELSRIKETELIHRTYNHLTDFWQTSRRLFDQTVKTLFEVELNYRGVNVGVANENGNEKDNDNINEYVNDNEDSSPDSFIEGVPQAITYYKESIGAISPTIEEGLRSWILKLSNELVKEALKLSVDKDVPHTYAFKVLKQWKDKGVTTLTELKPKKASYKNTKQSTYKEIIPSWMKAEMAQS